jgi:amphi-Trp domain-containing protein
MSGRITHDGRIDRGEASDRLNDIASTLRSDGPTHVDVGNKRVELHPPDDVNYSIDVVEKQRRFRGDRESITIELSWTPES